MISRSAIRFGRLFVAIGLLFMCVSLLNSFFKSPSNAPELFVEETGSTQKPVLKEADKAINGKVKSKTPVSLPPVNKVEPPAPASPLSSFATIQDWNARPADITANDKIYFVGNSPSRDIPSSVPSLPQKSLLKTDGLFVQANHVSVISSAIDEEKKYANGVAEAMESIIKDHPHMKYARANACIFVLCRNSDLDSVLESMSTFELTFNHRYNYPYVFVNNEEFTDAFKRVIQSATASKVEFGVIPEEHWSLPDNIDRTKMEARFQDMRSRQVMHGDSLSYRYMCRFNSRFFYHHPLLNKYRYYWRVEPGVGFKCQLRYDPLLFMALYNKKYAHAIMAMEYMNTVEDLWKHTSDFMKIQNIPMNDHLKVLYDAEKNDYNGIHFWSNFEIGDMSFYRGKQYEAYMDHLDKSQGFFMQRYGDAPVHTIAVAMLLNPEETHYFVDISYRHDSYYTCPVNNNEQSEYETLCSCQRGKDWVDEGWWGMNHIKYLASLNSNWNKKFH